MSAGSEVLWRPSAEQIERTQMRAFWRRAEQAAGRAFEDYGALWRWSVERRDVFWALLWEQCGVLGERGEVALQDPEAMPGARWFPEARLNYAENLLREDFEAGSEALVFLREDGLSERWSRGRLREEVAALAAALRAEGVGPGDRVAGWMPNAPQTMAAALAAASLGAVWSSASPDFGVQGVLDRFGQIEPKVLLAVDGYRYGGKPFDCLERLGRIAEQMPSLRRVVVLPYLEREAPPALGGIDRAVAWADWLAPHRGAELRFEPVPFDHPLFILFSSGTTGRPKCIVHGHGGTLLQHLKEHRLHGDLRSGERFFYFTTCGWMMWNWLLSGLASGAALMLYDGSPFHPDPGVLWRWAEAEGMHLFGTSAKYLDALAKAGYRPAERHALQALRCVLSTGSPLAPEGFDFVYEHVKEDLLLASISGGTDIVSCFVLGNPVLPVHRGEIQCRGLGMDVDVFDEQGRSLRGRPGELVCKSPFPSMPVGFWNDPEGRRYRAAYFERFEGVWTHGDWAEITEHDGVIIYGRSDATLNPGGVRIGTAEIYRQVEQIPEVLEALAIGQRFDGDERVVLFVRLREGVTLDEALRQRIRRRIRENTTPRHVPAKVVAVPDLPRTKSGKISELAVKRVVHGEPVANTHALANPEALRYFEDLPELREA